MMEKEKRKRGADQEPSMSPLSVGVMSLLWLGALIVATRTQNVLCACVLVPGSFVFLPGLLTMVMFDRTRSSEDDY